ncbi:type I-U CRISPR-associated protein Cas5/Cas6 [Lujinxingia litoralis]|uniref:Type I-U CRISPR-associated protein Cas5/Cas6 n=1 Tax=Lujinxingia litoralis TaxID=2211119 RepID=A0A328C5A9_9DELT|nr:type I-U CRISPR-associated protein Csb2 [Lujinxingia litoralis]RAL21290.1 type I-U CRISPR-associated protein Cas5/Cas6 [Lujinxingia litoralis]
MTDELTIALRYTSGHAHATPWDRQVNEGVVEWPPSPWRLLRTLISVRHFKARDEVSEEALAMLLKELSEVAPLWQLPEAVQAHTRHYMPNETSTTKVFDTFLVVDRDTPAIAHFPGLVLSSVAGEALNVLLPRVAYLGRAESWVSIERVALPETFAPNAGPAGMFEVPPGSESTRQLMPLTPEELAIWREGYREAMLQRQLDAERQTAIKRGKDPDTARLSKKKRQNIEDALPSSVVAVLGAETDRLQKAGWSQPPGSRWVDYVRPPVKSWLPPKVEAPKVVGAPTVARYAVASQVPPRLTTALYQCEKLHKTLASRTDDNVTLTGVDALGRPLKGHQHAFVFAEANDPVTDRITHLNVWAPAGFSEQAQRRVLDGVQRLWGKDGHDLQLILLGVGTPEDFGGFNARAGQAPIYGESKVWRSLTPFVGTRHPKKRKNGEAKRDARGLTIGGDAHDLLRLLKLQGFPEVERIEALDALPIAGRQVRWLEFATRRPRGGGKRGPNHGTGFAIEFAEPVRGPIAVGYGAHYGLGLFSPVEVSG